MWSEGETSLKKTYTPKKMYICLCEGEKCFKLLKKTKKCIHGEKNLHFFSLCPLRPGGGA